MKLFTAPEVSTPFGKVKIADIEIPSLKMPTLDKRRKEAIKQTIGADVATIFNLIPYAGAFISEQIGDIHMAAVKKLLTPQEYDQYVEEEKRYPTNIIPLMAALVKSDRARR